jgi:hypothetical protein
MGDRQTRARTLGLVGVGVVALLVGLLLFMRGRDPRDAPEETAGHASNEAERGSGFALSEVGRRDLAQLPAGGAELTKANLASASVSDRRPPDPGPRVVGRVVDEAADPIEGAEVIARKPSVHRVDEYELARSQADGSFIGQLEDRRGPLSIHVLAEGRARAELSPRALAGDVLDLGTVVLGPGGDVRGRVLEEGGRVPARAYVFAVPGSAFPSDIETHSYDRYELLGDESLSGPDVGADGAFLLRGVPPGEWFVLADAPGGLGWSPVFVLAAGESVHTDVWVPRANDAHWISGVVRSPDGVPLGGIDVAARAEVNWDGTQSSDDGSFRFEYDEPGIYELVAGDPSARYGEGRLTGVRTGSRAVELVLTPQRWLELRLVDSEGRSIAWGNVWSHSGVSPLPLTPLGREGRGRIPRLSYPLELEASAPGFRQARFGPYSPEELGDELVLVLQPGGFVRGRITSGGRPVKGARLDLARASLLKSPRSSSGTAPPGWPFVLTKGVQLSGADGTSDGDGAFLLSVTDAGWYALSVEAAGFPLTHFGPWELDPAGPNREIVVELARGGALEGRVRVAAGESPLGRFVGVSNGWNLAHTVPVDVAGRYRFADLAPGGWQVRPVEAPVGALQPLEIAPPAGEFMLESDVEVHSGATSRFDLDLASPHGCALSGHFRFAGVEVDGWSARLLARGKPWTVGFGALSADGEFRVVVPQPGAYDLRIGDEVHSFLRPVELIDAEEELELSFDRGWAIVDLPSEEGGHLHLEGTCADGTEFRAQSWCVGEPIRLAVPTGKLRARLADRWSDTIDLCSGEERLFVLPRR